MSSSERIHAVHALESIFNLYVYIQTVAFLFSKNPGRSLTLQEKVTVSVGSKKEGERAPRANVINAIAPANTREFTGAGGRLLLLQIN